MATARGNDSPTLLKKTTTFIQIYYMEIFTCNVLLLIINLFVVVMQGNKRPVDLWMFDPVMDDVAKTRLDSLLRTFVSAMEKHNIIYFMYQGTLLGSYRHHGHISWDDDIDFMLRLKDKQKVIKITENMGVKYAYYDAGPHRMLKFFYRTAPEYPAKSHEKDVTWPHIDVTFYLENETHLWDPGWDWLGYVYPKSEVFPLVSRPFDGHFLPSPCHPESVIKRTYDINICQTHMFNHRLFVVIPYFLTAEKNCDVLRSRLPFVDRIQNGCIITEILKLGGWTIREFNTTLPCGELSRLNCDDERT